MVTSSDLLISQAQRVEPNNSNDLFLFLYFQFVNSHFSLHCRLFLVLQVTSGSFARERIISYNPPTGATLQI